jgi:DNA-binding transcriptional LysR family regulator
MENLNNYFVFYTVAKTGNISKAAQQLFISQPAVSKSISRLEEASGVNLFDRGSRGVTLTEEGSLLYNYVEKAMDTLIKGEENLSKFNELGMGHIRIGVSTSLCKHILLDYLKDFIRQNPHIKVSIDCHSTINTLELLKKDDIDVGLICDTPLPSDMIYKPIKNIHDIFVASRDYIDNLSYREDAENIFPDKKGENTLTGMLTGNMAAFFPATEKNLSKSGNNAIESRDILTKSTLMVLEEANITRKHVDSYLEAQHIKCNQFLEINNMDLLIDFAAIGMGVASVVREFADSYLTSGQIIELPLDPPIPERTVGFVYRDTKNKSTALMKFLTGCGV